MRSPSVTGTQRIAELTTSERLIARATLALDPGEEAQSLTLVRASPTSEALFLVGTTRAPSTPDSEPTEGRLLVLRASLDGDTGAAALERASETRVGGCPYAAVQLALSGAGSEVGYVATAVNSQVAVWALGADGSLALSATWGGAFVAYTLAAREPQGAGAGAGEGLGDGTLLVGDALRSVTLLRYHPPASAPMQGRLEEVARDYRSRYMLGVAPLAGGSEVLGAETDLNLFTLERDEGAERAGRLEDAGVLQARGQWHLGEMVSRFRPGTLLCPGKGPPWATLTCGARVHLMQVRSDKPSAIRPAPSARSSCLRRRRAASASWRRCRPRRARSSLASSATCAPSYRAWVGSHRKSASAVSAVYLSLLRR